MFDIGWTELVVVAVVMILVVGPKDLPRMLRTFGQTIGKVRRMANEFQSTFNDALREAEKQADIADMKRQVEKAANFDPLGDIRRSVEEDRAAKGTAPATASAGADAAGTKPAPAPAAASEMPSPTGDANPAGAPDAAPGNMASGAAPGGEEAKGDKA